MLLIDVKQADVVRKVIGHLGLPQALAGDTSDGIPGVRGVGLKTAARIIREHGSVEALWARHDAGEILKGVALQRAASLECRADYARNLKLIDWRLAPPLPSDFELDFSTAEMARFGELCDAWGVPDVARSWRGFDVLRKDAQAAVSCIRAILASAVR